jgi:hypothetical protein
MMIRVSHSDVRVSHGMHVYTASSDVQVLAEGDSRAREVAFNSLMQPGVDFFRGSRAPKSIQALVDLEGARLVVPPRVLKY